MGPTFSLSYYDRIFGGHTEAYEELLKALADELDDYAFQLLVALAAQDGAAVAQLRHAHRPLVQNLGLTALQTLEEAIREALEQRTPGADLVWLAGQFRDEAQSVARALISARFPGDPEPPSPSPCG